ncbi:MAG: hypothetical protein U1E83_06050 [Methylotetracoccus sp.]
MVETELPGYRGRRYRVFAAGHALTYRHAIDLWRCTGPFRHFMTRVLAEVPFDAYRWECPPVAAATALRPFEFAVIDAPNLGRAADPSAFLGHFAEAGDGRIVQSFPNLGRDAMLVVPVPDGLAPTGAHAHLGAFMRQSGESQIHALWSELGECLAAKLGVAPLWVSTAGDAVAWLHVRIDASPKYYHHSAYRYEG